jgi:hypothetical protein
VSAASVATRGRAAAESLMVDTCTIRANDGETTYDPVTNAYVETDGTLLYTGPCQVQVTDTIPRDANVGDQQVVVERIIVKIPWDAVAIPVNSVVEITAAGDFSGAAVGNRYRVIGSNDKTYATATRLPCELISS